MKESTRIKSLENQIELLKLHNKEVIKMIEGIAQTQETHKSPLEKLADRTDELRKYRKYNQLLSMLSSPYRAYKSIFRSSKVKKKINSMNSLR